MNLGLKRGLSLSEKAIRELRWAVEHEEAEMILSYLSLFDLWQHDLTFTAKQTAWWLLFNSPRLFEESRALFYTLLKQYGDHTPLLRI